MRGGEGCWVCCWHYDDCGSLRLKCEAGNRYILYLSLKVFIKLSRIYKICIYELVLLEY